MSTCHPSLTGTLNENCLLYQGFCYYLLYISRFLIYMTVLNLLAGKRCLKDSFQITEVMQLIVVKHFFSLVEVNFELLRAFKMQRPTTAVKLPYIYLHPETGWPAFASNFWSHIKTVSPCSDFPKILLIKVCQTSPSTITTVRYIVDIYTQHACTAALYNLKRCMFICSLVLMLLHFVNLA